MVHKKIFPIVFWILLWQVVSMWIAQDLILVSPCAVGLRLLELMQETSFWKSILFSASRILGGFFSAAGLGILAAVTAARFAWCRALLTPMTAAIKATPVASFIILVLFWFSSEWLSFLISFLMVFPLIYANVLQGIFCMDQQLSEMGQVFRLSLVRRIQYLYAPQVFPYLRAAFATGLGMCWKAGTAAEVIGITDGSIGERLQEAKIYLQMPDLFAWTVVIIVVSLLVEKMVLWLLDWCDRNNKRGALW